MTPLEMHYLQPCNGFGRDPNGPWFPYVKRGDVYYTPSGLLAIPPREWRPATPDEIIREMDERGEVPMPDLCFAGSAMVH